MKFHLKTALILLLGLVTAFPLSGTAARDDKSLFTIDDYFQTTALRVADLTRDGRWAACQVSTYEDRQPRDNTRYGDPTYISPSPSELVIIDTLSGDQSKVFQEKRHVRSPSWSPGGVTLAFFLLKDGEYELTLFDRVSKRLTPIPVPFDNKIASNSPLIWSEDGRQITFTIRSADWESKTRELFDRLTKGPIIVMDTDEPFLKWDEVRRRSRLAVPVVWDLRDKKLIGLMPETPLLSLRLTDDGSALLYERDVTEKTSYAVIGGTKNQLEALPLPAGKPRVLLKPYERRSLRWSKDSKTLAYAERGDVFVMSITDKAPRRLTGTEESRTEKTDPEREEEDEGEETKKKQSFSVIRFSPDGATLLCSSTRPEDAEDEEGGPSPPPQFWLIDARTGDRQLVYELPEEEDARPDLQVIDWGPDGRTVYFSYSARDRYDRGLVAFDLVSKEFRNLRRSDRLAARWRMSENGSTFLFMESDGDVPDDLYAADRDFSSVRQLTHLNPQFQDKALSHTELISYRDADGTKLHGVLYYPANYEKGKTYPLITEVYEQYFDNGFNPALNIFTSAGYAVLHPSVNFTQGYPGEAWAKGALSAINKVIEMGVADPDKLGIQGTSYGGYATVLLITQTDRFKAAINNSGKVNMVSFYTQSPRLGIRNTHAPERSQDRIGGTLREYPERYLAHSAVLEADRINTPLLCITGDLDPNVEALQSQEIYYALRRLGKKCVWLRYSNGAHGGPHTKDERRDMYTRMLEWYDTYLKGEKR